MSDWRSTNIRPDDGDRIIGRWGDREIRGTYGRDAMGDHLDPDGEHTTTIDWHSLNGWRYPEEVSSEHRH